MPKSSTTRRPQARAEVTKAKILDAAQLLFTELGFENTQLDEVAARAGCSRGGIYAHYESKEDLFLALLEQRAAVFFSEICKELKEEQDLQKRRNMFKDWYTHQIFAPDMGNLTMEFKLYAVRRPEMREKLLHLHNSLFVRGEQDLCETLFGKKLNKAQRIAIEQRLAVLSSTLGGMVLECHFRPTLLTSSALKPLAEEIFDALLHL